MPHFSVEYSSNLDSMVDITAFLALIHTEIMATGLFELGAVRVRAFRSDAYAVADLLPENGFIDMQLRVGAGRSGEDLKRLGETIFEAVSAYLKPLFQTPHFALSLEIREIDPDLSWKKNAIHPRLRT